MQSTVKTTQCIDKPSNTSQKSKKLYFKKVGSSPVPNVPLCCRALIVGGGCACVGTGLYGNLLHFPLSFAMNLKLLHKIKVY